MKTAFLSFLSFLLGTASASFFFGSCPTFNTQSSMDFSQYTGRWYEYTRDWSIPFQWFLSCTTATYGSTYNDGSGGISVINRGTYWPINFLPINIEGRAQCDNSNANCAVSFSNPPNTSGTPNYNVISTDYTSYAIVYTCTSNIWWTGGLMSWDFLWVLSRTAELPADKYSTVENIISTELPHYWNWANRLFTMHWGCWYE